MLELDSMSFVKNRGLLLVVSLAVVTLRGNASKRRPLKSSESLLVPDEL